MEALTTLLPVVQTQNPQKGGLFHSAREGPDHQDVLGKRSVHFEEEDGRIRCTNFIVFWYLDEALEADGVRPNLAAAMLSAGEVGAGPRAMCRPSVWP